MGLRQRLDALAAPYAVGVASRAGMQALAFVQVMVASRYLGLADFGSYALAWAAAVIAQALVYTGPYQGLLRSTDFDEDRDSAFWMMAAVGGAGAATLWLVGQALGGVGSATGMALVALAPLPALKTLSAWNEAQLVRDRRVRIASAYVAVAEFAALVATVVLLHLGHGILALIAGRYVATALEVGITFAANRAWPGLRARRGAMRRLGRTALPIWGTSALGLFANYGADLILGAFLNPAAVGAYRGGARISGTISDLAVQPLMLMSWSRFTQLEKQGRAHEMRAVWLANMAAGAALVWPLMASVALLAPEIISVVFVETWLPAAGVVSVLLLARSIGFLSILLEPTLICQDRGGLQVGIRAAGAAMLLGGLLSFGRLGPEAAAAAMILSAVTVAWLSLRAMLPSLGLRVGEVALALLPGLGLAAICGGAVLATAPLRAGLSPEAGLAASIAMLAVLWGLGIGLGLRGRLIALPQP